MERYKGQVQPYGDRYSVGGVPASCGHDRFYRFFRKIAGVPSENIPYYIFSYSGLIIWTYFSSSVSSCSESLLAGSNLITKVYFPRIILPLSCLAVAMADYIAAFGVLLLMALRSGIVPGAGIFFLPIVLVSGIISSAGLGIFLSALNVKYRDVRHVIPFFIQTMLFASPVIY